MTTVFLLLLACDSLRATIVELYPQDYAVEGVAAAAVVPGFEGPDVAGSTAQVQLEQVTDRLEGITDIQFPPGRSDVLVATRKSGRAVAVELAGDTRHTVLDLSVKTASEMGLLGLAFHPTWPEDPRIFVNYNPEAGEARTRIASFRVDPTTWAASDEVVLLEVAQPYANHDAGQLLFGPDGMLYIGLGDGGWRDDPHGHGQNAATLLGSMLRIDVDRTDGDTPYAVPPDNPFLDGAAPTPQTEGPVPPETWAIGLRNPWKFSWDPAGRMVVADVGQNLWEEVALVAAGDNLGWKVREGAHCFPPEVEDCPTEGLVDPVFEYDHSVGQSITGGFVYTADDVPALTGRYLVADFVSGRMWALGLPDQPSQPADVLRLGKVPLLISTFGRDADGRVYVGDYGAGRIYRFVSP